MATLATLRTRARQMADMENSLFVSDAELTSMVNASYLELYDLIVDIHEDYYVTTSAFTLTTSDVGVYSLPATFYKLRGIDYLLGSDYVALYPFQWSNRNQSNRIWRSAWSGQAELGYRMVGSNLRMEPSDSASGTYRLWYIPSLTQLSAEGDVVDTVMTRAGWEEYIVIDAARKMRIKEESSIESLVSAKAAIAKRITESAANRDADQPASVSDVYLDSEWSRGGW